MIEQFTSSNKDFISFLFPDAQLRTKFSRFDNLVLFHVFTNTFKEKQFLVLHEGKNTYQINNFSVNNLPKNITHIYCFACINESFFHFIRRRSVELSLLQDKNDWDCSEVRFHAHLNVKEQVKFFKKETYKYLSSRCNLSYYQFNYYLNKCIDIVKSRMFLYFTLL